MLVSSSYPSSIFNLRYLRHDRRLWKRHCHKLPLEISLLYHWYPFKTVWAFLVRIVFPSTSIFTVGALGHIHFEYSRPLGSTRRCVIGQFGGISPLASKRRSIALPFGREERNESLSAQLNFHLLKIRRWHRKWRMSSVCDLRSGTLLLGWALDTLLTVEHTR